MGKPSWLARFRRPRVEVPFAPHQPFYAVGDLHGRSDLLERMLSRITEDSAEQRLSDPAIVFLGDYVDRGEDSAGVLTRVRAEVEGDPDKRIALLGNHEAMMLAFLETPVEARRWLRFGGLQTLASFGVPGLSEGAGPTQLQEGAEALRAAMPEGLLDWMRACPSHWISGNMACVHAGADPRTGLAAQEANTLIWGHRDFMRLPRNDGIWVIHGHTVVDVPEVTASRIAVDTGAYFSDRLTACRVTPNGDLTFLEVDI